MKDIKCNFKNLNKEEQSVFSISSCVLLISVGQQSHESGYFSSTISLVNKNFKSCTIALYDSLQRYTMALSSNKTLDNLHVLANKEGDEWLHRNQSHYNKLDIPLKITRWDEWLYHHDFLFYRDMLKKMTEEDASYKKVFDIAIDKYLSRAKSLREQQSFIGIEQAEKLCFDYILEECAVLCLWPHLKCQYEIYPSIHNEAMEETRNRFIYPKYPNLLRPLTIRFRGGAQMPRQEFTLKNDGVKLNE